MQWIVNATADQHVRFRKIWVITMYTGLILKDDRITISKEETWNVTERAVSWQPKVWTAIYVEGKDKDIKDVAELISNTISDKWYANLSGLTADYVIFHKKIFSYPKGINKIKQEAIDYGKSIGVPGHQLDW